MTAQPKKRAVKQVGIFPHFAVNVPMPKGVKPPATTRRPRAAITQHISEFPRVG